MNFHGNRIPGKGFQFSNESKSEIDQNQSI